MSRIRRRMSRRRSRISRRRHRKHFTRRRMSRRRRKRRRMNHGSSRWTRRMSLRISIEGVTGVTYESLVTSIIWSEKQGYNQQSTSRRELTNAGTFSK